MKYLILSLVANLLVFGVLSAIGLNINILAAMMIVFSDSDNDFWDTIFQN